MTSRQKVFKLAKELNAVIEINNDNGFQVNVIAPEKYYWREGCTSELVEFQNSGFKTELLWQDLLDRMNEGLEIDIE